MVSQDSLNDDMSEEDLALKEQLELYVEQVQEPNDHALQRHALEGLKTAIRTSTASLTCVPKPLKFLRPYYETLREFYENMVDVEMKKLLADILSVLAMTRSEKDGPQRESLMYRLLGTEGDISTVSWGHAYVNVLADQIKQFYAEDGDLSDEDDDQLKLLVQQIVAFYMKRNGEPEAVDLLMDVGDLDYWTLVEHVNEGNYKKTCLYLTAVSRLLPGEDCILVMKILYSFYLMFGEYVRALQAALFINKWLLVRLIFVTCQDNMMKKQLCYILARHRVAFEISKEMVVEKKDRKQCQEIIGNLKLSEGYLALARDLDVMEPKSPEDIYKSHLIDDCEEGFGVTNSARQNLAAAFVNAFVNAGFGEDDIMTPPTDSSSENWLFKNKDHGKMSAAASLGVILLWDPDSGHPQTAKYLDSDDMYGNAGALLSVGIISSGIKDDYDSAYALLVDYLGHEDPYLSIGAIMGVGIAYANSQNELLHAKLIPILENSEASLDVVVFAALSLALVYAGSCDQEAAQAIISALKDRSASNADEFLLRLLPLALGLVYLGKQDNVDATMEVTKIFDEKIRAHCEISLLSCAFAGTGDVLEVQALLAHCQEHQNEDETDLGPAVIGIAMIAMAEEIGTDMAIRSLGHLLQYGDHNIRRAVPLALALLSISNPKTNVMDSLSTLTHDSDSDVAMSAIVSLGFIGAGTNNARAASLLRNLSSYYCRDADELFCVRIAQGLVHLGKGLMTLNPYHSDHFLLSPAALSGLVIMLHSCLDMKTMMLGKYHYVLYFLVLAMQPRMLLTVDENLEPLPVPVRVGQAVDVVGQAGQPKNITGFRTYTTPVLLSAGDRAELATDKYVPLSPILEGFIILKDNPEYTQDQ